MPTWDERRRRLAEHLERERADVAHERRADAPPARLPGQRDAADDVAYRVRRERELWGRSMPSADDAALRRAQRAMRNGVATPAMYRDAAARAAWLQYARERRDRYRYAAGFALLALAALYLGFAGAALVAATTAVLFVLGAWRARVPDVDPPRDDY